MIGPTLVHALQASVARAPDAEAIIAGERRVRYGELWHQVDRVATFLRDRGLSAGERVALWLENSAEYVAAYYGALAAGGVVVPLNTGAKAHDIRNWLAHAEAAWLIGDARHPEWGAVRAATPPTVSVLTVGAASDGNGYAWDDALGVSGTNDWARIEPTALAAILYTSGTTGQPKGIMLSHRNLTHNVASILAYLELQASDRALNVLPFFYSYGNSVLHTHLAVGGSLVLENSLAYPHRILERMVAERATGFSGVPSTYALLLSRVKLEDYDLRGVRYLTQAGGAMAPALIARVTERLPHARFFVMYGQTEATARLSYLPPSALHAKLGSVGIAIPGVTLEIRDENGLPVPPGTVGEIWAKGDNIMLGYWRDADTTAAVLRDGWLRTGDLAYADADGYLFIQGRRSDMIKSGAHRINPKDVEEAIAEIDGVAEVAVIGVDDPILGQVIKAVVVMVPGGVPDAMAIKAHCRIRLANYKIPKFIEFVPALPKTASGKIKRYELAAQR